MEIVLHLVAALWIADSVEGGREPSAAGLAFLLAGYYALGRGLLGALAAAALRPGSDPAAAARAMRRGASLYHLAALPASWAALGPGGWIGVAEAAGEVAGGASVLATAMAPWIALRIAGAAAVHPPLRSVGLAEGTFLRSLLRSGRMAALILLPIAVASGILVGAGAAADAGVPVFREADRLAGRFDFVRGILTAAALALTFLLAPRLAMVVLGARPLAAGPLRDRLEAYARRVGLRYHDLYVWRTGGTAPNAAVLGIGARFRCVIFTDALLDHFEPDEVEAVFAHEAGHAIHHHIPLFFLFTMAFMLAVFLAPRAMPASWEPWFAGDETAAGLATLAAMLLYFGLVFGWASRRIEQQADVHGLLTTGLADDQDPREVLRDPERHPFLRAVAAGEVAPGAHPFVRALDRIGGLMGGLREVTGWRHFSLGDRVAFLRRFAAVPDERAAYARRIRSVVGGMVAVFAVAVALGAADLPAQWAGPHPAVAVERARAALARGDGEEAHRWIAEGARGAEARGLTLSDAPRRRAGGRPVLPVAALEFGQIASAPAGTGASAAFAAARAAALESLALDALGRPEEAVRAAGYGVRVLESLPAPPRERLAREVGARRAEALLALGDALRRAGRGGAAEEAWARALVAAREAGKQGSALAAAAQARGRR